MRRVVAGAFAVLAFLLFAPHAAAQVVINEIHYNPVSAGGTEEFLEFHNRGNTAVNIGGWSIADAISLTVPSGTSIPAHGYFVVALNPAALQAATGYAGALQWTSGNLSNGGEIITLRDAALVTVDVVNYDDAAPWPLAPDGSGPSLELINPTLDNNAGASWAASTGNYGTPGAQNSVFSNAPAVESEIPARRTAVASLASVSVTFTTSVTGVTAAKLSVGGSPAATLSCASCSGGAGTGPYVFSGFAAPAPGSVTVTLSGAGILAGSVGFSGDSWTLSTGVAVVINELHYHPPDAAPDAEFLELYNAGAGAVSLAGWTFAAGITGTVPAGTTIAAGGYVVFAKVPAEIQANTGYAGSIAWGSGSLSNGGETVAIADTAGNVIDSITYGDSGAWPNPPDGDGPSLELVNPNLPNQFGGAWRASLANWGTPGAQNSTFLAAPPPIIASPSHTPILPAPNQAITVSALVFDDQPAAPTVTLYYRQDFDPTIAYSSTPMFDDGLHGDGAAGDSRFGATVPGLPDGARLDFTLRASDGTSTSAAPLGNDTLAAGANPSQTFLAKFSSGPAAIDFPHYHLITTQHVRTLQDAHNEDEHDATFVRCTPPSGTCELFYNIVERYRGQSSLNQHPHSFRIGFPASTPLQSELGFPITKMNLMAQEPDRQFLGYGFFGSAFGGSIPVAKAQFVRLDTNPLSHGGIDDYAMVNVEKEDEDFLDSQGGAITPLRFPGACSVSLTTCSADTECPSGQTCVRRDTGNIYKGVLSGDLQYRGTDPNSYRTSYEKETNETDDIWTDLIGLTSVLDADTTPDASYETAVNAAADELEWARYFAVNMLLVNQEGGIYRDTGDDFYLYFEPPTSPLGTNVKFIPRDMDSTFGGFGEFNQETIWRTTVPNAQRFVRNNAYAGRFVGGICDLLNTTFTQAAMDARIDALPDAIANAAKKAQFKSWVAARIAFVNGEIQRNFTLTGVPASPYTAASPALSLGGTLSQCGTYRVTVNGVNAAYSIFGGTWSRTFTLAPGINNILVQQWDAAGTETARIERTVIYNPPGSLVNSLRLEAPHRMAGDKTLTVRAELLDPIHRIITDHCDDLGSISAVRVSNGAPVPITVTTFESHTAVPADSIRFYNGVGSISFTLDHGAAEAAGDIDVTVTQGALTATRRVTIVPAPTYRAVSGTLSGAGLTWGPNEFIRLTGNATVPSGSTLTIHPGTLVMVDTTGGLDNGTLVTVQGAVSALGTEADPIFFYSAAGPAAMTLTQSGSASNANAWRGLHHFGPGSSTYRHVFLTGAGNGVVVSHPRPPILSFNDNSSFLIEDSTIVDNDGMAIAGPGNGQYTVRRSLLSRNGIGAEFNGNGHTLLVEDSWWTATGWAPEPANLDGDLIHVDGPASTQMLRRSVFADGGDDGIDHNGSSFTADSIIIRNIQDKAISMTGGHVTMNNSLIFATGSGIRGFAAVTNTTINSGAPIATVDSVSKSIIWPSSLATCPAGVINHSDLGNAADLGCGTGNISVDPQFTAPGSCNYRPAAGSPANTAGPAGERIGWLGFPIGQACTADAQCNDNNGCSFDTCVNGACTFSPIANCIPCSADAECSDGNACTDDTCNLSLGRCQFASDDTNSCTDGVACTADACVSGTCTGTSTCGAGSTCNTGTGLCSSVPQTLTFRDGVGGYTGTQDTYLAEATPAAPQGSLDTWRWDTEDPAPSREFGLIRFDGILGPGPGQIPAGATITSATLTLNVFNAGVAPTGDINLVSVDWSEALTTWNNFGGEAGVQADEFGASAGSAPIALGNQTVNVTSSVQAWVDGTSTNYGWIFRPNNNDGVQVRSAEYATLAERPQLSVTYVIPSGCSNNAQCSDGNACNGVETCSGGTCVAGTPLTCNDGNLCTDDTCAPATGCVFTNNTAPCTDGSACTVGDVCSGGICAPGAPLSCNDGVACTTDSCSPASGCQHADACTGGQTCNLGTGVCDSAPQTLSFRDGVGGYTGTQDTYLAEATPAAPQGALDNWRWDTENPAPSREFGLIRFDGIVGAGVGQIPPGAHIASATLTLNVSNSSVAPAGDINLVTVDWNEAATTWNDFGGEAGVQADEFGASAGAAPIALGTVTMDVTASVQAWVNGTANFGWIFRPNSNDGMQVRSAEYATIAERPGLSVTFVAAAACTTSAQCDDGLFCNGAEVCSGGSCVAGTPPSCDDGLTCSTDTCNESIDACDHSTCSMTVTAAGPRALAVTPPAGLASVALRVTSAGLACLPRYVDAAGHLTAAPVFRSSAQWGTVFVADRPIVPSTSYSVSAEVVAGTPIGSGSAATWAWGDVDNVNGVNLFDILCVVDGSHGIFTHCASRAVDLQGNVPDGVIDSADINAVLGAFSGSPYPDATPCAAPLAPPPAQAEGRP